MQTTRIAELPLVQVRAGMGRTEYLFIPLALVGRLDVVLHEIVLATGIE
jgi:hypothetical protein